MTTPTNLRTALAKDFTKLFKDDLGKTINIYEKEFPKKKYEKDESKKFPFVLIETESGKLPLAKSEEDNLCQVNIITGINQDDDEQPETESLIERICLYLIENEFIGEMYEVASSIEWRIGEDEVMPFEYGIIQVSFKLPKIHAKQSEYI